MNALLLLTVLAAGPDRLSVANVFRQPAAAPARNLARGPAPVNVEPVGPANGSEVTVALNIGTVTVETKGRVVPCQRNKTCVQLPNGRRATGSMQDGRFVVEEQP